MGSTARKTRNYKEKSSMLAFGHIALPLAAVIALGLLFVGIKLFFLSPAEKDVVEVVSQPRVETQVPVTTTQPADPTPSPVPENNDTAQGSQSGVLLAGPIAQNGATPSGAQSEGSGAAANASPQTSTPSSPSTPSASSSRALTSKYGVQIGAFVRAEGAEEIVQEVTKEGYVAAISPIDSSGKTYHRVRVAAGDTKEEAERLAAELKKKGYPVLVVANP